MTMTLPEALVCIAELEGRTARQAATVAARQAAWHQQEARIAELETELAGTDLALRENQSEFALHMVQWNEMRARVQELERERDRAIKQVNAIRNAEIGMLVKAKEELEREVARLKTIFLLRDDMTVGDVQAADRIAALEREVALASAFRKAAIGIAEQEIAKVAWLEAEVARLMEAIPCSRCTATESADGDWFRLCRSCWDSVQRAVWRE